MSATLFAVTLPSYGGDTQYVNMHSAYDDLPAETKQKIDELKAVHVYLSKYSPRLGITAASCTRQNERKVGIGIVADQSDSSSPMSVMRTRTVAARMAATITKLLWNKGYDGSDSRANKNRLYVRTDVRRLRRTTRFERNDPNNAQTRSCPRKRERALHRTADTY